MIYNTRNKGTRKPVKSPILTILNHLCGIEHVKKILRNVPLSVPLFCKKRIFEQKKATSKPVTARNAAPKWKHCINITQTSIKQLFTTTYQVRLDDHRPPGDFTAPVRHSGVQEAVLRDPHFLLRERVEDSRNRPEIVVLLFKNQMNMDYLCHNLICTFYAANIPNNYYLEVFE